VVLKKIFKDYFHINKCKFIQFPKWGPSKSCLIDWLIILLRPAQEFFHLYGDITTTGEGLQNFGLCTELRAFEQGGIFMTCHTCCDTGPRFFPSHPKDCPIQSPLMTHRGMWRIYSYPDPHGSSYLNYDILKKQPQKQTQNKQEYRQWYKIGP
jgi:hypothetical protein